MPVSIPFEGSGEFVRENEWSCPRHERPQQHECDCQYCDRRWECELCATAEWRDLVNADGSPKMRELSKAEVAMREWAVAMAREFRMAVKKAQAQVTFSNVLERGGRWRPLSWIYRRWAYLYSDDPALD